MKMRLGLSAALLIAAACAPVGAHHQSSPNDAGYVAFWKGVLPVTGAAALSDSPDFWKKAFVSKYSLVGFNLPSASR